MKKIIILTLLIVSSSLGLYSVEIEYDEVLFENSKGEIFTTKDNGKTWHHLKINKNPFEDQVYISNGRTFESSNKGKDWTEIVTEVENQDNKTIQVFPNPVTSNKLNLELESNLQGNCKITIFTIDGKEIFSDEQIEDNLTNLLELNLPDLSKGIFIISLENDGKVFYSKFIVE